MKILFLLTVAAALPAQTLTLQQAVTDAIAGNLDIAAARYGVTVAEARQITAALRPNPVFTTSANHLDLLGTRYNTINNGGPNEFSARTDFLVERGQKREARIELAAAEKTVAQLAFQDAIRRLILDVQTAFTDALAARDNLTLAQDNLRSLTEVSVVNRARVNAGDLAVVELNRSLVAVAQLQNSVRQAEVQLIQARRRLQLLLGRTDDFEISGELRSGSGPADLPSIRESAIRLRPDLELARRQQARNQADLRLQLAQGRIDWTVGAEYVRQQAPSGRGNSLGLYFSTPIPIFNKNQGEIERSRRETEQAGAITRALEARIANEAATAWEQYSAASRTIAEIEKDMLARARDVRATTEYSYRRGEATLVEFLDAQRAFNDTIQAYNNARAEYARSLYLIDAITATPPR